jgi:hypothetical protein
MLAHLTMRSLDILGGANKVGYAGVSEGRETRREGEWTERDEASEIDQNPMLLLHFGTDGKRIDRGALVG